MYLDKLERIREKILLLLERNKELEADRKNLLDKIRVLEKDVNIERSSTGRPENKAPIVQHSETVKSPTLFEEFSKEDLKKKMDEFIENIDQCIEIIEKK